MQQCLRELEFLSALYDFDIHQRHIPGEQNSLADALSRWDDPPYQIHFARTSQELGISYVFEEIPADFFFYVDRLLNSMPLCILSMFIL